MIKEKICPFYKNKSSQLIKASIGHSLSYINYGRTTPVRQKVVIGEFL